MAETNRAPVYKIDNPFPDDTALVLHNALKLAGPQQIQPKIFFLDESTVAFELTEPRVISQDANTGERRFDNRDRDQLIDGLNKAFGAGTVFKEYENVKGAVYYNGLYQSDRISLIDLPLDQIPMKQIRSSRDEYMKNWVVGLSNAFPSVWEMSKPGITVDKQGKPDLIVIPVPSGRNDARSLYEQMLDVRLDDKGNVRGELPWNASHVARMKIGEDYVILADVQALDTRARDAIKQYAERVVSQQREEARLRAEDNTPMLKEWADKNLAPLKDAEALVAWNRVMLYVEGTGQEMRELQARWTGQPVPDKFTKIDGIRLPEREGDLTRKETYRFQLNPAEMSPETQERVAAWARERGAEIMKTLAAEQGDLKEMRGAAVREEKARSGNINRLSS